jgi:hypothetical protein
MSLGNGEDDPLIPDEESLFRRVKKRSQHVGSRLENRRETTVKRSI